jgi:hypothetical protein
MADGKRTGNGQAIIHAPVQADIGWDKLTAQIQTKPDGSYQDHASSALERLQRYPPREAESLRERLKRRTVPATLAGRGADEPPPSGQNLESPGLTSPDPVVGGGAPRRLRLTGRALAFQQGRAGVMSPKLTEEEQRILLDGTNQQKVEAGLAEWVSAAPSPSPGRALANIGAAAVELPLDIGEVPERIVDEAIGFPLGFVQGLGQTGLYLQQGGRHEAARIEGRNRLRELGFVPQERWQIHTGPPVITHTPNEDGSYTTRHVMPEPKRLSNELVRPSGLPLQPGEMSLARLARLPELRKELISQGVPEELITLPWREEWHGSREARAFFDLLPPLIEEAQINEANPFMQFIRGGERFDLGSTAQGLGQALGNPPPMEVHEMDNLLSAIFFGLPGGSVAHGGLSALRREVGVLGNAIERGVATSRAGRLLVTEGIKKGAPVIDPTMALTGGIKPRPRRVAMGRHEPPPAHLWAEGGKDVVEASRTGKRAEQAIATVDEMTDIERSLAESLPVGGVTHEQHINLKNLISFYRRTALEGTVAEKQFLRKLEEEALEKFGMTPDELSLLKSRARSSEGTPLKLMEEFYLDPAQPMLPLATGERPPALVQRMIDIIKGGLREEVVTAEAITATRAEVAATARYYAIRGSVSGAMGAFKRLLPKDMLQHPLSKYFTPREGEALQQMILRKFGGPKLSRLTDPAEIQREVSEISDAGGSIFRLPRAISGFHKLFDIGAMPTASELEVLREVFGNDFIKVIMKERSKGEKFWNTFITGLNIPRALLASGDMSAMLRQAGVFAMDGKAGPWRESVRQQYKAFKSKANARAADDWIKNHPYYDAAVDQAQLSLTEASALERNIALTSREEVFAGAGPITKEIPVTIRGRRINVNLMGRIVSASERAHVTMLNQVRFRTFVREIDRMGGLSKVNAKQLSELGRSINIATGRGDLGSLTMASLLLNSIFFSPRLAVSRFQLPIEATRAGVEALGGNPTMRRASARALVQYTSQMLGFLTLLDTSGVAEVGWDPRSSDFMKIRILGSNTRYDPWMGLQQPVVLVARLASMHKKSITTGDIQKLNAWDALTAFMKNKLHPALGGGEEIYAGKVFGGEELFDESPIPGVPNVIANNTVFLWVQDVMEAFEEEGFIQGAVTAPLAFAGVSTGTIPTKGGGGGAAPLSPRDRPTPGRGTTRGRLATARPSTPMRGGR